MNREEEIVFLEPVFKEMIWGGNRLATEYHYNIPSDKTGECWAVSAHEAGDCIVAKGKYKGQSLSSLWNNKRELFGNIEGERFPLLVKIIDAKEDLSIQVHPDDEYARIHANGSLGKTECWYILDCEENSEIIIGHNAKDKKELVELIEQRKWNELIRTIPIKKGDFFQIDPGTVHAIKGGTLLLEIQQNSDITYRLYDYGRLSNGAPRELHLEKSIDVIQVPHKERPVDRTVIRDGDYSKEELVRCCYYFVEKLEVHGNCLLQNNNPFLIMSVLEGEGLLGTTAIKKGDHFILPHGFGDCAFEGELSLLYAGVNPEI